MQGRDAIALKDPLQLSDQVLCVDAQSIQVLALLDGKRNILDIMEHLTRQTGQLVPSEDIITILEKLDELYLLEGDRAAHAFQNRVAEYRKLPFRECSHAGASYPADPEELRNSLDSFFTDQQGPGLPEFGVDPRKPSGLIAPHIDVRAGGRSFAHAYHALAAGAPSEVYIIFGTGHAGVRELFTATTLDFQTPLGTVTTNREFIQELSDELGHDSAAEEILHATEHVIEFQVLFLQHLISPKHDFTIVPILVSLSPHYLKGTSEFRNERKQFDEFCAAIRKVCESKSVCFISSADLDHIGPRYGDDFRPTDNMVTETLDKDRKLTTFLEEINLEAFVDEVAGSNDTRRICGFSPIAAMLTCMDASEGKLLDLDFAYVDNRSSFVSFASMIFY
jgi:AmmeMemoRadiSam system protein B